jgi:hypothetical protein
VQDLHGLGVAMAENKTKPTQASVEDHIAAIASESQRADCRTLIGLIGRITQAKPTMWGPSIVGFGSYHYKYDSGREGDSCLAGFAARKGEIAVYLVGETADRPALLAKLGRHKIGKACLYIRRLGEVDMQVLEQLIAGSVAEIRRRYGSA